MPQDIVLIPSQLCTELVFAPQMPVLSAFARPRVFVQRDRDTVGAMARSVLDASPQRFTLITHGMGGFVAFEMLRRDPKRIEKLVLMSALAPADTPKQTERRMGYIRLVEQGRYDGIIEERIPMLVHPSRVGDEKLTGVLRRMASDTGAETFQRQQRAIMARPDSRPMLASIACPTMLVFGRQDGITTIEHQKEMLEAIPDVRLEVIEDCGHMMTLEKPDEVNALLKAFLS
ncbi:MAG TPA: alpha/beta hydrolase [Rhizomicrobium sp.]|nr:alpha/beta hydrolase [Rhizomicrobium sp.]